MEKLIEKFEDIVNDYTNIAQEVDAYEVAPAIAEEARKLAIAYSRYYFDEALNLGRDILPDEYINTDLILFEQFINKYYE